MRPAPQCLECLQRVWHACTNEASWKQVTESSTPSSSTLAQNRVSPSVNSNITRPLCGAGPWADLWARMSCALMAVSWGARVASWRELRIERGRFAGAWQQRTADGERRTQRGQTRLGESKGLCAGAWLSCLLLVGPSALYPRTHLVQSRPLQQQPFLISQLLNHHQPLAP